MRAILRRAHIDAPTGAALLRLAALQDILTAARTAYRADPHLTTRLELFSAANAVLTERERLQARGLTVKVSS